MMKIAFLALLSVVALTTNAFQQLPSLAPARGSVRMFSSPEDDAGSSSRLGSSIDQDGKSNIWAVEPKMRVDEAQEGGGQVVAVAIGAALAFGLICASFLLINVEQ